MNTTAMNLANQRIVKSLSCFLLLTSILLSLHTEIFAQYPAINEHIAKHRKGELLIKAKPGDKVTVGQLWTRYSGTVGTDGIIRVPAFFGKHKITVGGISQELNLTSEKATLVTDFTVR